MDPLAQLQDIQLPDKIHNYPIAIGWWLLAAICIIILLVITFKILQYKKSRRAQQQALTTLNTIEKNAEPAEITGYVTVLKWAASSYFPRENIAHLYGAGFNMFLLDTLPIKHKNHFQTLAGDSLQNMYQKNSTDTEKNQFHQACVYWLKNALPPKNLAPASKTAKASLAKNNIPESSSPECKKSESKGSENKLPKAKISKKSTGLTNETKTLPESNL